MIKNDIRLESAVNKWVDSCEKLINDHMTNDLPEMAKFTQSFLAVKAGTKYFKILRMEKHLPSGETNERGVFAFIDADGNVLKPAGYKKPAKHARGNLFDNAAGMAHMSPYGPAYMSGM